MFSATAIRSGWDSNRPWRREGQWLAIAGLIIFNTMLGSIAERRREIHVYTSLGLAPMHVGALFVAEALTYGLIGTVFGYVIGQGAGTALLKLGWLGNVTLNYSGTSAILTMGLILLIVLLSALVPARVASKIAAPSIDRSWKVPQPSGDEIRAHLPFTINRTAAGRKIEVLWCRPQEFTGGDEFRAESDQKRASPRPSHQGVRETSRQSLNQRMDHDRNTSSKMPPLASFGDIRAINSASRCSRSGRSR